MPEPKRKGKQYAAYELDWILSLAPTDANIVMLAKRLERSEEAIAIVYRIAFERGPFGKHSDAQRKKIAKAKARLGITAVGSTGPAED